ncbi:ladderlectin isoform X2 [Dicentrarchus labrax]|uniref:ladderlectin isoform X2 n=1 Tax=Dicentrarchus labrax TaxID=13489 RepID=UPI0021F55EF5|nr:ladderlectin isoform X2 [Dicentrarchus labrax]
MKILTAIAVLCAMMALTRAFALPEAEAKDDQTVKSHLVKRSTACPNGWSLFNDRCFHYYPRPTTWAKAEKNCQSLGANLASVQNIQEYHEIQRLITAASYQSKEAWLGGSDAQEERLWLWSDGSPFSYLNWCNGQPDNYRGQQHCLQMNFGADKCWDDVGCGVPRPFVCAKKV